mmetsp:Transcript_47720/g.137434  ORF Transcript_47720/g.137434 Transcript_47720/m.137434 type:complete len:201 (-) Transcript_47720:669-1271(-)
MGAVLGGRHGRGRDAERDGVEGRPDEVRGVGGPEERGGHYGLDGPRAADAAHGVGGGAPRCDYPRGVGPLRRHQPGARALGLHIPVAGPLAGVQAGALDRSQPRPGRPRRLPGAFRGARPRVHAQLGLPRIEDRPHQGWLGPAIDRGGEEARRRRRRPGEVGREARASNCLLRRLAGRHRALVPGPCGRGQDELRRAVRR